MTNEQSVAHAAQTVGKERKEPSASADCSKKPQVKIRVIPNVQIAGHFGIFSYIEKIDGSTLYDPERLVLGGASILSKWITPGNKRIYFIPPNGISNSLMVYFDSDIGMLVENEVMSTSKSVLCINSMNEQMKVLQAFRKEYKSQEPEDYNDALYNAHMRYWKVMEFIEKKGLNLEEQRHFVAIMREINERAGS